MATLSERALRRLGSRESVPKVVNLIDFGECNSVEPGAPRAGEASEGHTATDAGSRSTSPGPSPGAPNGTEELLGEIAHLRQRLADAQEEQRIQREMAREELAEKQREIDELRAER